MHAGGHRFNSVHLHHFLAGVGTDCAFDLLQVNSEKVVDFYETLLSVLVVKLLRANGGCLGVGRRGRARIPAISFGEPVNRL